MDVTTTAPEDAVIADDGQATTMDDASSTTKPTVSFEDREREFFTKKGWDPEKGREQLLDSYTQLESKLGNFKDLEEKAQLYESLGIAPDEVDELRRKAQAYDESQSYIEELKLTNGLSTGEIDYSTLPTDRLAQLWEKGQIGLADIPPNKQFEVQKYAIENLQSQEREYEDQAKNLQQEFPEVFADSELTNIVATMIEAGVDAKVAAKQVSDKLRLSERKGEEKVREEINKLKDSGLERTSSAASTVSNTKAKSIRDAFNFAIEKHSS